MNRKKDTTYTHAMELMKSKRVNVAVKKQTYFRLLSLGRMRDSFDKVISRLIDDHRDIKQMNVSEAGSGIETLDQLPTTTTTLGLGENLGK